MAFCAQCGTKIPEQARFCPSCGAAIPVAAASEAEPPPPPNSPDVTRSRPAPPPPPPPPSSLRARRAAAPPPASDPGGDYDEGYDENLPIASLGRRVAAHLIDFVPVMFIYSIVGTFVASSSGGMTENGFDLEDGPALLAMIITYVLVLLYFTGLEAMPRGQTFGKMAVGIKVTNLEGGPADFGAAFMRNLLRIVDGLFFYAVGLVVASRSEENQRLGDKVAKTLVLRLTRAESFGQDKGKRRKARVKFSMGRTDPDL